MIWFKLHSLIKPYSAPWVGNEGISYRLLQGLHRDDRRDPSQKDDYRDCIGSAVGICSFIPTKHPLA